MAIGPWQILVIVALLLLLFGAGRLSEIGKGLGSGIRNFKEGLEGEDDDGGGKGDADRSADQGTPSPKSLPGPSGVEPAPGSVATPTDRAADGGGAAEVAAAPKQPPDDASG